MIESENKNLRDREPLNLVFEEEGVTAVHNEFESRFRDYFSNKGYNEVPPLPLLSEKDKSVIYTGSTISPMKKLLLDGDFVDSSPGFFVAQECIRTGAKDKMFDKNWLPYGQIYFNMISTLSKPGRFKEVFDEALEFTCNEVGLEKSRIKILSSRSIPNMSSLEAYSNIAVEYDSDPDGFYEWEYGIDGIYGTGLTIAVYNKEIENWMEVGNIISICDETGKELGVEFGYGYEYFLAAVLQRQNPLELSKIFDFFDYEVGNKLRYYYNLEAVANMKAAGSEIGRFKSGHIFKTYLKSLLYNGEIVQKDTDTIISEISRYLHEIKDLEIDLSAERAFLEEHTIKKSNFKGIIRRSVLYLDAIREGKEPKEKNFKPEKTIIKYLRKNGLRLEEVESELQPLQEYKISERIIND
ncbi:MAG: alanine--tRNA ligase-related protein [Candidatus Dojkabacteria bacterium]